MSGGTNFRGDIVHYDNGSISGRSQRGGKTIELAELVKSIRISTDANDIDCSNIIIIYMHI